MLVRATTQLIALNAWVRKHFVHLISTVALIAFMTPGLARSARGQKLGYGALDPSAVALFLMMLSASIQCGVGAFRAVLVRPRPLLVCLGNYFLILPLCSWLIGQLCVPLLGRALGEPLQLGINLVVLMPVAATTAIWVRDSKGDIELLVGTLVITMALVMLSAPLYLSLMNGAAASSIVIPQLLILRQLIVGVLVPLVIGVTLNRLLGPRVSSVLPYFTVLGNLGLFMAVYLNVGTAGPLLRRFSFMELAYAALIVLAVNVVAFVTGEIAGRLMQLGRDQQVTCGFASGMRSNGTALVVGLVSFPHLPLVTVPAAIYIIFQHLLANRVRVRLAARFRVAEPPLQLEPASTYDAPPVAFTPPPSRPRRISHSIA